MLEIAQGVLLGLLPLGLFAWGVEAFRRAESKDGIQFGQLLMGAGVIAGAAVFLYPQVTSLLG